MEAINLDLLPGAMPPIVHVSQGDVGRQFSISIYDDTGAAYPLTGKTLSIVGHKGDGNVFQYAIPSSAISGNVVTITTEEQMTPAAGKALCEIRIEQGGTKLGTCNFVMDVEQGPADMGSLSRSALYMIDALFERAQADIDAAAASAATASQKAADAASSATDAASSANASAASAATATAKANAAAKSATDADKSAEAAALGANNAHDSATKADGSATAAAHSASVAEGHVTTAGGYAVSAQESATKANSSALSAASSSDTAYANANKAAESATAADTSAKDAKDQANLSGISARDSADSASASATSATNSAASASAAAASASAAAKSVEDATAKATEAAASASASSSSASEAAASATAAEEAKSKIENMTASAQSVAFTEQATVTKSIVNDVVNLDFKIPRGQPTSGHDVEVNPTGDATGGDITKLGIDGTVYNVSGLPDYSQAADGDVLTNTIDGPVWSAPSGGKINPVHSEMQSKHFSPDGSEEISNFAKIKLQLDYDGPSIEYDETQIVNNVNKPILTSETPCTSAHITCTFKPYAELYTYKFIENNKIMIPWVFTTYPPKLELFTDATGAWKVPKIVSVLLNDDTEYGGNIEFSINAYDYDDGIYGIRADSISSLVNQFSGIMFL